MKLAPALSLGLAIILGAAALLIGRGYLGGGSEAEASSTVAETVPAEAQMTEILVAAVDIEMSAPLTPDMVVAKPWPNAAMPLDALRDPSELMLPGDQPMFANGFIAAGEPILGRKLVIEAPRYNLASIIPEGFRAISIGVTMETGVAGFVLPGDRVDITAFVQVPGKTGPDAFSAKPLLSGVLVLAIDQIFNDTVEGAKPSNTVTLALTPDQARMLAAAARDSRLGLALIGEDEAEKLETDDPAAVPTLADLTRPKPRPVKPRPPRLEVRRPSGPPKQVSVEVIHGTTAESVVTPNTEAEAES